jgi:hypothetical protein
VKIRFAVRRHAGTLAGGEMATLDPLLGLALAAGGTRLYLGANLAASFVTGLDQPGER